MKAFFDYYRLTSPGVYEYLLCLTGNTEIAEKLLEETYLMTNKLILYLKKAPYLAIWTFSQAKLKYEEYLKAPEGYINERTLAEEPAQERQNERTVRSRRTERAQVVEEKDPLQGVSQDWIELRQKAAGIEDPVLRDVMALILFGGQDFKEVAMILGKTEMWAKMAYYRGKMQMFGGEAQ